MDDKPSLINSTINALYRYPVKGLSAERLQNTMLNQNMAIEHDRSFAIEAGTNRFNPEVPSFLPKVNFLMLMRDEALASLSTRYDPQSQTLIIEKDAKMVLSACLAEAAGRAKAESFFADFMPKNSNHENSSHDDRPKVVCAHATASGFTFSDWHEKVISIVNLASVEQIAAAAETQIDPLRFRANIYVTGLAPWAELDWVGKTFKMGKAELVGVKRTQRCKAINVAPAFGRRDLDLTALLPAHFGHSDCGIYMRVCGSGMVSEGDPIIAMT